MYTAPPWRRRGIAAFLLGRIVEEARARGYERLRLQPTDDGKPLYRGAGFRDEGRDMVMELGPRRPREGGHS
jgi:GNAT superfamily N-acetyltransferase